MIPEPSPFPAPSLSPCFRNTFSGIWRLTARRFFSLRYWASLVCLGGLLYFSGTRTLQPHAEAGVFVSWVTSFYLSWVLPILSFISAAGALRDDSSAVAGDYLFTRPVRRGVFVYLRYLAQMGALQLDFLFTFVVISGIGVIRQVPDLAGTLPVLWAAQFLLVAIFAALGVLCAVLTARYVVLGIVYAGVVELGLGSLPTQIHNVAMTPHVMGLLQALLPSRSAHSDGVSFGMGGLGHLLWIAAFFAVALVSASLVFGRQERSGSRAQEL